MDWSRAKTILILSFLLLNVLLGYQLWSSRMDRSNLESDTVGIMQEVNKLLASKNIRIQMDVPKDAPKLNQISVKLNDKYRDGNTTILSKPIRFINLTSKNIPKEFITKAAIEKPEMYQYDSVDGKDSIYVFNQMTSNVPMFDINLKLFVQKGEITGYKQVYVEVQSEGVQKEQKVISAYTAIRSLAENFLAEGSIITDIRLGYHGQQFDSETQYMLPYWRIKLADGSVYFVQAFNGAVEGPQVTGKS
jgi:regulatory protein YycI of two-component signal transduction system YycFG